ncbi:MAG: hypothetical protein ACREA4_07920 [Nitrososphaera sp.]
METGTFTLEIEEVVGGETATTTVFTDIPVRASSTAKTTAGGGVTPTLLVDLDNNGTTDITVKAGETENPLTYVKAVRAYVKTMSLNFLIRSTINLQLTSVETLIKQNKPNDAKLVVDALKTQAEAHMKIGMMKKDEGAALVGMLTRLKGIIK